MALKILNLIVLKILSFSNGKEKRLGSYDAFNGHIN